MSGFLALDDARDWADLAVGLTVVAKRRAERGERLSPALGQLLREALARSDDRTRQLHDVSRQPVDTDGARPHGGGAMTKDSLLTLDDAAEMARVSRRTLERRVADGSLEVVRIGRRVRVTRGAMAAMIGTDEQEAAS